MMATEKEAQSVSAEMNERYSNDTLRYGTVMHSTEFTLVPLQVRVNTRVLYSPCTVHARGSAVQSRLPIKKTSH